MKMSADFCNIQVRQDVEQTAMNCLSQDCKAHTVTAGQFCCPPHAIQSSSGMAVLIFTSLPACKTNG